MYNIAWFAHKAHYFLTFFGAGGKNGENRNLAGFTTGFEKKKKKYAQIMLYCICETTKHY